LGLVVVLTLVGGCGTSGPSDSEQQVLAKDYAPANLAREYEKHGEPEQAAEVRQSASRDERGDRQ
jgi:hypothetical protein